VHFGPSPDQQQLREAVQGFLRELRGARAVLEGAPAHDPEVWQQIAEEQGWQAVVIPEEEGGFGFGWTELAIIFEELGRTLTPCPLLPTSFATAALLGAAPSDHRSVCLAAIAEGSPGALALNSPVTAREDGGDWVLEGEIAQVVGGMTADVLVVQTDQGLFALHGAAPDREELPVLDPTRPLARIRLQGLTVSGQTRLQDVDTGRVQAYCETMLANESVGAAQACLDLAVDYAKVRRQFDRPIGSFQAVQHMCADMMVAVESARSAAWYAAWACDSGADNLRLAARTAKATASDALMLSAGQSIQVHGGIGFTWEHDAHLYFKRARSSLTLLGSPTDHREAVATVLLGDA
jgi:alkylation response protein AidB-like acyl-CoA dehydrogenase